MFPNSMTNDTRLNGDASSYKLPHRTSEKHLGMFWRKIRIVHCLKNQTNQLVGVVIISLVVLNMCSSHIGNWGRGLYIQEYVFGKCGLKPPAWPRYDHMISEFITKSAYGKPQKKRLRFSKKSSEEFQRYLADFSTIENMIEEHYMPMILWQQRGIK